MAPVNGPEPESPPLQGLAESRARRTGSTAPAAPRDPRRMRQPRHNGVAPARDRPATPDLHSPEIAPPAWRAPRQLHPLAQVPRPITSTNSPRQLRVACIRPAICDVLSAV